MAKSKRVLVSVFAFLIILGVCTVGVGAFETTTGVIHNAVAIVPIDILSLSYQVDESGANVGQLGYVDISPPTLGDYELGSLSQPNSYSVTPKFTETSQFYGRDDEFAIDLTINQSTTTQNPIKNITSWGLHNVNTATYGRETSLVSGGTMNFLSVRLIGNDFVFKREYFDYTNNIVITTGSSIENNFPRETQTIFKITFIVPTVQADGSIALLPVSITDDVYYDSNSSQTVANLPLFITEADLNNSIRNADNITTAQKEYMLNCEYFYVEGYTRSFSVPEIDGHYQASVIQTYIPNSVYAENTSFKSMINNLPTGDRQVSDFNLLGTVVSNLDDALSIPIIGDLTIGWIVGICVAIGALFGILKYFAGG